MIINNIKVISHSKSYWLAYILGGAFLLCTALYYQFVLEELPCVACIQIRLWVSLMIIVACAGLLLRHSEITNTMIHFIMLMISAAMTERSYLLLGTERGFVFADCGFDLGLPAWFAIDSWLPWLYRIETSCGYTPEIFFGITIAEALMVISILLLLVTGVVFILRLMPTRE